ncbi:MAG: S41 family peptidase [Bacteroidota bacterium]
MHYKNRLMFYCHSLLLTILLGAAATLTAQEEPLTTSYKNGIIQKTSKELIDRYVFPDIAQQIAADITQKNKAGYFDPFTKLEGFIDALNDRIYQISKDKHISLTIKEGMATTATEEAAWYAPKLEERTFFRRYNANFKSVEKLEDNIAYLDLRGFYGLDYGRNYADYAMAQMRNADAIIIDLRKNSGGRGDMVEYLLSYFFEEPIVTGRSRKRSGDRFVDRTHTSAVRLTGKTLMDVPVFILTSSITFSAAESFCYPMQAYGRATIIGEVTKGGANAGDLISIDEQLNIFIPDVAALPHPKTNTMWEGVGIIPDIKVDSSMALETAMEHAKAAAAAYKQKMDEAAKAAILELNEIVSNYDGTNDQTIIDAYLKYRDQDVIFEEWELNALAYQCLSNDQLPLALALFKTNTALYPHSAKAFQNYAEALANQGNTKAAITNYEQALALAEAYQQERLIEGIQKRLNELKE